jgi:3'(2'), 5'-bisphosphate nucleotidase
VNTESNKKEMDNLLSAALTASLSGAHVVMEVYSASDWDVEEKADKSPLTRADREAHSTVHNLLSESSTEIPILSEEGAHLPYEERRNWKQFWMVDPLDGTKEFLSRHGEFTVNVALVAGSTPVLGIVSVPAKDTYYIAVAGGGSFRAPIGVASEAARSDKPLSVLSAKGTRLHSNKSAAISGQSKNVVRVIASRSHLNPETQNFIDSLQKSYEKVELIQAGSAVKLCRVAEGLADYYPRLAPTMEWDTAAGDIVVREAGGQVLVADGAGKTHGAPLTYNKEDLHNPYFIAAARGFTL